MFQHLLPEEGRDEGSLVRKGEVVGVAAKSQVHEWKPTSWASVKPRGLLSQRDLDSGPQDILIMMMMLN